MSGIIIDVDENTGMEMVYYRDPVTGNRIFEKRQDTEGTKLLTAEQRENVDGTSWQDGNNALANIPLITVEKWRDELNGEDPFAKEHAGFLMKKLNSAEYAHLRIRTGTIQWQL